MKRVLYLSYDGMTDPLGQSQVLPYIKGLTDKGYEFTILSFEKPDHYATFGKGIHEQLFKGGIQWFPLTYHKKPPVLSTLYDLWQLKRHTKKLHKKNDYKIVHCRSYISALVGLYLKKKYGLKFIFDMRGFWADERVEGGIWDIKNPIFRIIYKFFKKQEKHFLEKSDFTISLTKNAKNEIHNWKHIKNNPIPIQVIPCCADLAHFDKRTVHPEQLYHLRNVHSLKDTDFILLYLGSIGTWYMLDEMLDFFKVLLQYKESAKFLILTKDDASAILAKAVKKGIHDSHIIITSAERAVLPDYLALAHLSIFFIKPVFSKKASSPTKQGELMGMGVPIICNDGVGDTGEIIQKAGAGVVIAGFTVQNYNSTCEQIDKLLSLNPEEIREEAKKYYSLTNGVNDYHEVYKKIV